MIDFIDQVSPSSGGRNIHAVVLRFVTLLFLALAGRVAVHGADLKPYLEYGIESPPWDLSIGAIGPPYRNYDSHFYVYHNMYFPHHGMESRLGIFNGYHEKNYVEFNLEGIHYEVVRASFICKAVIGGTSVPHPKYKLHVKSQPYYRTGYEFGPDSTWWMLADLVPPLWNNLQTGDTYAIATILGENINVGSDEGKSFEFELNARALEAINAAKGGRFAISIELLDTAGYSEKWLKLSYLFNLRLNPPQAPSYTPIPELKKKQTRHCPRPVGHETKTQSRIINSQLSHWHMATDYQSVGSDAKACSPCETASAILADSLPSLRLDRIHRYKDFDMAGSFGPGVFSGYDARLSLFGSGRIELWMPGWDTSEHLIDLTASGIYRDIDHETIKELRLTSSGGELVISQSSAVIADLTLWDGTGYRFELYNDDQSGTNRSGRLIRIQDRNLNAISITYQDAVTATDVQLQNDRSRLRRVSQITDAYGKSLTCAYVQSGGQWVVSGVSLPNATQITYSYGAGILVGVTGIAYPDATTSSFSCALDKRSDTIGITINDAGAETTHRRKCVYVTKGATSISGAPVNQAPNRVRRATNGDGEISFLSWATVSSPDQSLYIYEGGNGLNSGVLIRADSVNGVPTKSLKATSFNLTSNVNTYTWELIESYQVDAKSRITGTADAQGRPIAMARNTAGNITGRTIYASSGGAALVTETTQYNAFEQPTLHFGLRNFITENIYDTRGNILTRILAKNTSEQSSWYWTYNGRGQVLTATDANGSVTNYVYEENPANVSYKRLISIIYPADISGGPRANEFFQYDSVGRRTSSTNAAGSVTTRHYDLRNRTARVVFQDTSYEEWTYGSGTDANLLTLHRDRNGNRTSHSYDNSGRSLSQSLSPQVGSAIKTTTRLYLPAKELLSSESIDGSVKIYTYDNQLRMTGIERFGTDGKRVIKKIKYGASQLIDHVTDENGCRTYFLYDRLDRVTRQVKELIPNTLSVPTATVGARDTYLSGLTRVYTPNPGYVIEGFAYDWEDHLVSSTDRRGVQSETVWDGQGRMKTQVEASTDASTIPSTIVPYAARTEFGYDANGNRTTIVHPRSFTRNPTTGEFTQIAQPYVTVSTYTGRNLLKSVTEASGTADAATVNYTYTLTKQTATQSDPRNATWLTTFTYYACCNRLHQVIDALGFATTYTYDANSNVLTVRDANNTGKTHTYDARNRQLTITNTDTETTTFTYDENLADAVGLSGIYASKLSGLGFVYGEDGAAVEVKNHLNETTFEVRDGLGRLVRVVDGNGNQTTASYDRVVGGLVATSVTDALANSSTSYADGSGFIRQVIDAQNRTSTATFDANGNQLSTRDPNNVGWTATYDLRDRRLTTTDTHGDATVFTYDLHGNVLTTRDALLKIQQCTYDYRDRKVTCTDRLEPVAGITGYQYDKANHLVKISDADSSLNGITDYIHDQRGMLQTETFPVGKDGKRTSRTYTYDNGGRLWKRTVTTTPAATPALNELTTYVYDNANRLTGRTYSDGTGNDGFTYDDAGRLRTAVSGRYGSTVTRTYTGNTPAEKAGRLTSEQLTLSGANAGLWTVAYQYDAANRLTTLTYPTSDTSVRTYTSRNQLDTVTFAGANVATRAYDNGGRLATTTFGNSLVETRTYRSDANGVDNQLTTQVIPGVTNFAYAYDANKRITHETNGLFSAQTQQFNSYDNENRLTGWSRGTDTQSWTLSKVGDWTSTTINGVAQPRTHSAVHEVTAIGGVPLSYDLKGNLTQNQDGALYSWDSENRLTAATVADTDYGVTDAASYRYDALGRRVQKSVYGMVTTFIHAGAQVIHEFDAKVQLPAASANDDGTGAGTPPGGGILQGAGVTRFNYQPSLSPIPSGFFADKGKVHGTRSNGKSYGWLTTARTDTVIRNQHPYPQFDTFNQAWLNNTVSAGTWEITLANGTYAVVVVMGDPASANQTNNITIEGVGQTDPDPAVVTPIGYRRGDFDGYAVTANVIDGKLTLAIPATANNPKLCFIEIGAQGSSITQADRDRLAAAIEDATAETGLPPYPKPQPTPRQYVYGSYVDEPLVMRAAGNRYYYASNRLYSVAAITSQAGQVVERYKYDAYGKQGVLAENGVVVYKPSDYGQFHGFTGRYHDWETGLAYFRARYFDHSMGRFINRDPLGYVDGYSMYSAYFVPNHLDPDGKFIVGQIAKALLKAGGVKAVKTFIANEIKSRINAMIKDRIGDLIRNNLDGEALALLQEAEDILGILNQQTEGEWSDWIPIYGDYQCSSRTSQAVLDAVVSTDDLNLRVSSLIERVGPHTVGPYEDVEGHHPHQQAARNGDPNYDPEKAIAVADDGTFDHDKVSAEQNKEWAKWRRENPGKVPSLADEEAIQRKTMKAGGMKDEHIETILEKSRNELKRQGSANPTRAPGTRKKR